MKFIKPPIFLKIFYGHDVIWNIPSREKTLYLTFDDGPVPEVTHDILSFLKIYNAKATFFYVGENVVKYPELFRKVLNEGHNTGNHTYNHMNGWKTRVDEYVDNVKKCNFVVQSKLFRPPFGKIKYQQIKKLRDEYRIIMWSALSYDFHDKVNPEQCFMNVRKNAQSGSIIVFHDSIKAREKVLYALPKVLDYFSEQGYNFKSIPLL